MCTRGKVISLSIGTKTAISWDVGMWVNCKYDQTVKWDKNLAWLYFKSMILARIARNNGVLCWPHLSTTPTVDHVFYAHVHKWLLCILQRMQLYIHIAAAHGVRALQSSSSWGWEQVQALHSLQYQNTLSGLGRCPIAHMWQRSCASNLVHELQGLLWRVQGYDKGKLLLVSGCIVNK